MYTRGSDSMLDSPLPESDSCAHQNTWSGSWSPEGSPHALGKAVLPGCGGPGGGTPSSENHSSGLRSVTWLQEET